MLTEPLPHPGQFGGVVIDVLGEPSSACTQEGCTPHSEAASMTLRVSWVPSWT